MSFFLPMLAGEVEFHNKPVAWSVNDDALSIEAGPETDWFFDPSGGVKVDIAPAALFSTRTERWLLSACVRVDFSSTFDAGVLQIRSADSDVWGKLCFEYSPQQQPMIVSVVTHGLSDDCNSVSVKNNQVFLRVARVGQAFAFHYSLDGKYWNFVRHFGLGKVDEVQVGFSAQSPTGAGCRVVFSEISYEARGLEDLRSGE